MLPALDRNTLDRLISLGHMRGQLTTEDLRENLPIGSMTAEEIALIVVHLEESGVPVELEQAFIPARRESNPTPARSAEIIPFPGPSARARTKLRGSSPGAAPPPQTTALEAQPRPFAHWAVIASGLAVLAVLLVLVALAVGR